MQPGLIDQTALDLLLATTDREFVGELIDAYLEDSPGLIAAMLGALALLILGWVLPHIRAATQIAAAIPFASIGGFALSGSIMFFVYAGAIALIYIKQKKRS